MTQADYYRHLGAAVGRAPELVFVDDRRARGRALGSGRRRALSHADALRPFLRHRRPSGLCRLHLAGRSTGASPPMWPASRPRARSPRRRRSISRMRSPSAADHPKENPHAAAAREARPRDRQHRREERGRRPVLHRPGAALALLRARRPHPGAFRHPSLAPLDGGKPRGDRPAARADGPLRQGRRSTTAPPMRSPTSTRRGPRRAPSSSSARR